MNELYLICKYWILNTDASVPVLYWLKKHIYILSWVETPYSGRVNTRLRKNATKKSRILIGWKLKMLLTEKFLIIKWSLSHCVTWEYSHNMADQKLLLYPTQKSVLFFFYFQLSKNTILLVSSILYSNADVIILCRKYSSNECF